MIVSVVIPSCNHRDYVVQAIESVLEQDWTEIDLIVIDDGSTDGSAQVIRELHAERGGFRFVSRENRGLICTLNEGLAIARGEFFCELASDDFFPEGSLKQRVHFLLEYPECVAVFADGWIILGEEETKERFINDKRRRMFSQGDPIPAMLEGALPVFSTGMIRRSALERIGGFDDANFSFYEDLDTPILLALEGSIGYLDVPVICRRLHDSNVSGTTPHIRFEKINFYKKLLNHPDLLSYKSFLLKKLCSSYLALARNLSSFSDEIRKEGEEIMREAWRFILRDPRLIGYLLKLEIRARIK